MKLKRNRKALEFYSTQSITQEDKDSVVKALSSDFLSRGPRILEFEKTLGEYCENDNVISLNSATSALQLAYQLNGISRESLVWTSPITFVATANAAMHFGAKIDFVDIDPYTLNISTDLLEEKLNKSKKKGALPDFLTVVHFGGSPCEMDKVYRLSREYNFKVIEDASHALGASYKNSKVGRNNFSDASIFSFHPVKMITTCEGGALLLNTREQIEKATSLRSHGIQSSDSNVKGNNPGWFYEQHELGYNFRMSEIQAALGLSQISRLIDFVSTRNRLAEVYKNLLKDFPVKFQSVLPSCVSSYHLFTIEITDPSYSRRKLYEFLKAERIGCQVHYIPVHLQPFYRNKGFSKGMFRNAEKYYQNCLSLPLHQGLDETDLGFVCKKLRDFF